MATADLRAVRVPHTAPDGRRSIGLVAEISVFRPGDVSYLRIPAQDPERSAAFFSSVFGWRIENDRGSFGDATGHIIGHFMEDLPVAGEAGVIPYIYVQDIDETLAKVIGAGGEVSTRPYPEGDLWVAITRDPAGNAIGVWQHGPRLQAE
jgi:predicted enzyme related to lactoylglutathione lyase